MAITRTTTTTIAAAEVNDQYGVDLTIHQGREKLTVRLTRSEAFELAEELEKAVTAAHWAADEDGAS